MLDLFQILIQMVSINTIIEISGADIENQSSIITYDNSSRTNGLMLFIVILSATQILLIGQRGVMIVKRIYFSWHIREKSNPVE